MPYIAPSQDPCKNKKGETPALFARAQGKIEAARKLEAYDGSAVARSKVEAEAAERAFIRAAGKNNIASIEAFLLDGVDVNVNDRGIGRTALHVAAACGHMQVIDFLVSRGADVHAKTRTGTTPAMLASGSCKAQLNAYEKQYPPGPRPSSVPVARQPNAPFSSSSSSAGDRIPQSSAKTSVSSPPYCGMVSVFHHDVHHPYIWLSVQAV
jgi:ankyrin repeat protein